jgi:hypothetical protein
MFPANTVFKEVCCFQGQITWACSHKCSISAVEHKVAKLHAKRDCSGLLATVDDTDRTNQGWHVLDGSRFTKLTDVTIAGHRDAKDCQCMLASKLKDLLLIGLEGIGIATLFHKEIGSTGHNVNFTLPSGK